MLQKNKFIKYTGLILFSLSLVLFSSGCAGTFAKSLVYPNRQPLVKNPSDYGMEYRDISFKTPDNLTLAGWFIPGKKESLCVIAHPMNFTRYGYSTKHQGTFKITDIEVEFLNTVDQLNKAGHSILMFDLRNHGISEGSPSGIFGLGVFEWQDVIGALDYIEQDPLLKDKPLFFVSFCTGANATIIAMHNAPEKFKNVHCLAAIQPISTKVFVEHFIADKYPLFKGIIPGIEKEAVKMGSPPFAEMDPSLYVTGITTPVFYVQVREDKWTDWRFVQHMYDNSPEPKEILYLEGKLHRFDAYNYFGKNPVPLLNFIDKYL